MNRINWRIPKYSSVYIDTRLPRVIQSVANVARVDLATTKVTQRPRGPQNGCEIRRSEISFDIISQQHPLYPTYPLKFSKYLQSIISFSIDPPHKFAYIFRRYLVVPTSAVEEKASSHDVHVLWFKVESLLLLR